MKRSVRFYFALYTAKLAQLGMKILKRNATYLPGKIAIKLCPTFLGQIEKPKRIIGVTGTNGKTTVSNMIVDVLTENGYQVLNNRLGSNINSGIASSLISGSNLKGNTKYELAVLEIDERSSKLIYPYVKPDYIVCTNLFRDSIKRNAHTDFIVSVINSSIPKESKLIVNGDDLVCCSLGKENEKIYFGIDRLDTDVEESNNIIADVMLCPECGTKLKYKYIRYHHIGETYCPNCDFHSPKRDYFVTNIDFDQNKMTITTKQGQEEYDLLNNSVFNIYNMLATISVLREFGIEAEKIRKAFQDTKIVNTRFSKETVEGIDLILNLSKGQNPVACSRVFDYTRQEKGKKDVIIILDDVSDNKYSSENITWLYDSDFEFLKDESIHQILIGGIRCYDYYLRLLIAGVPREKLVCTEQELDLAKEVNTEGIDKIFILHDMYKYTTAVELEKRIKQKIQESKEEGKE